MPALSFRFSVRRSRASRRSQRGMTLIELLTVAAIIVVLATIALPAYNMYALRAKFSEVVSASEPTKTAIATCVATSACTVTGGVISVAGNSAGGVTMPVMTTTTNSNGTTTMSPAQATPAQMWAFIRAMYMYGIPNNPESAASQGTFEANAEAQGWANTPGWNIATDPSSGLYCVQSWITDMYGNSYESGCLSGKTSQDWFNTFYNSAVNPYWSAADDAALASGLQSFPCVGSSTCTPSTKYVSTVTYNTTGVITATASTVSGLNAETFTLTPVFSSGSIDWQSSGTCKTRGIC